MIVVDIDRNSGKPAQAVRYSRDTLVDGRVAVGEAIDRAMKANSRLNVLRHRGDFRVACEIGEDSAKHQTFIGVRQVQMCEEVQEILSMDEIKTGSSRSRCSNPPVQCRRGQMRYRAYRLVVRQ